MQKARSRLTPNLPAQPDLNRSFNPTSLIKSLPVSSHQSHKPHHHHLPSKTQLITLPIPILQALLGVTICYSASFFICTQIHPSQLQNFLLPDSYLPLQIILLLGNTCLIYLLVKNFRRALLIGLFFFFLLFFKLQQVILDWWLVLGLLIFFVIIELGSLYFNYLSSCKLQPKNSLNNKKKQY